MTVYLVTETLLAVLENGMNKLQSLHQPRDAWLAVQLDLGKRALFIPSWSELHLLC